MGQIVGAGLVAHVPTIVLPEDVRRQLNEGREISLVPGLHRLRAEVLDHLEPDTIVVLDSHWATTVEFVTAAHPQRSGFYTSDELPRGMSAVPYDIPGDPELARAIAEEITAAGSWATAIDDDCLPIHYPTVNLLPFLQRDERWVSMSVCQTAETDDFLLAGEAIGRAVERLEGRRVVVLASGGMSHEFWPLRQLRQHESSDPSHIITPEARRADEERLEWFARGDHARVIDTMAGYLRHKPEARFGHYLMMVAAVGGRDCVATGERFSDYENSIGTGQVHVWFERPQQGWTGA
jgi:3,4-dihydroxyphenylacetate 2,3-dioxygenase